MADTSEHEKSGTRNSKHRDHKFQVELLLHVVKTKCITQGRAVQQWPDWSRNLAVALQSKSRGDMYADNMLEALCKQLALERPSCRRV